MMHLLECFLGNFRGSDHGLVQLETSFLTTGVAEKPIALLLAASWRPHLLRGEDVRLSLL